MRNQIRVLERPGGERTAVSGASRWLVLAVTAAAQFMVILDVSVVNVALPAIKDDLHFSQEGLQWVITAYAILFGGVLLLGGRLADLLGRRRVFMAGVGLFTFASLLSGLASSEGELIATRALQGLGGALLAPAALSIVVTTFREGHDRNVALAIWGAISGVGGAVGVLLGGVLTSYLSWSWIFYVNLPVGLAVLAVSPWLLSESRVAVARRHFDVLGATSVTAGLMVLVYAITRASQHGWGNSVTVGLFAAAAALIAAFVAIEAHSPAPLLPLRIFRLRTLTAANATMMTVGAVAFGQFFLLTLYLQEVLRYSALQTGVAFVTLTVVLIAVTNLAQKLTTRLGARPVPDDRPAAHGGRQRALRADARGRSLLLERRPRPRLERRRARAHVRAGDDRRPDGCRARRRRCRVRAHQHEPADRRRNRARRGDDDRRHREQPLRLEPRRAGVQRPGAHARLPGRVLRVDRCRARRRGHHRRLRRVEAEGGRDSGAGRARARARRGRLAETRRGRRQRRLRRPLSPRPLSARRLREDNEREGGL